MKEQVENELRFTLLLKACQLIGNTAETAPVSEYNQLLAAYQDLIDPDRVVDRKAKAQSAVEAMKNLPSFLGMKMEKKSPLSGTIKTDVKSLARKNLKEIK